MSAALSVISMSQNQTSVKGIMEVRQGAVKFESMIYWIAGDTINYLRDTIVPSGKS